MPATPTLVTYVPALAILAGLVLILAMSFRNLKSLNESGVLSSSNLQVALAGGLFALLLVVQLFREQPWIADILKVLTGAFIGAAAAKASSAVAEAAGAFNVSQSGVGNKAAGRDLIESVHELKGNIENLNDAVVHMNAQAEHAGRPAIRRNETMRIETEDPMVLSELRTIQQSRENNWSSRWIDTCLSYPEFTDSIRRKANELRSRGWVVTELGFDNLSQGLHVNFTIERKLEI